MGLRIAKLRFREAKEVVQRMPLAHLAFLALLLPWMFPDWTAEGHTLVCVVSGILLALSAHLLDFDKHQNQLIPGLIYCALLLIELIALGSLTLDLGHDRHVVSKGLMFELLVAMLPWLYLGTRVLFVFPFISFFLKGRKLESIKLI